MVSASLNTKSLNHLWGGGTRVKRALPARFRQMCLAQVSVKSAMAPGATLPMGSSSTGKLSSLLYLARWGPEIRCLDPK